MDNFQFTDLYDANNDLHFRKGFNAVPYTAADFQDLKDAACAYVKESGAQTDWDYFQYYLAHNRTMPTGAFAVNNEKPYYWWKGGKDAEKVSFTLDDSTGGNDEEKNKLRADALAAAMSDAAFRSLYNGNTKAWDDLTAVVVESGRLVKSYGTEQTFTDLPKLSDGPEITALITAVEGLLQSKIATTVPPVPYPMPVLTWEEIQDALFTDQNMKDAAKKDEYWWKEKDNKPSQKNDPWVDFQMLVGKVGALADAINVAMNDPNYTWDPANDPLTATEVADLRASFTPDIAKNIGLVSASGGELTQADLDNITWEWFDYNTAGCYDSGSFVITWAQIQDAIISAWLNDDATAQGTISGMGITDPSTAWPISLSMRKTMAKRAPTLSSQMTASEDQLAAYTEAIRENPELVQRYEEELEKLLAAAKELEAAVNDARGEAEAPAPSAEPTQSPVPAESAAPAASSEPAESPAETPVPQPSETSRPTETSKPVETSQPTVTPEPEETELPRPTETPEPEETEPPRPAGTPEPEETQKPAETPEPDPVPEQEEPNSSGGTAQPPDSGGTPNQETAQPPDVPAETKDGKEGDDVDISNFDQGVIALTELLSADSMTLNSLENSLLEPAAQGNAVSDDRVSGTGQLRTGEGDRSETGQLYKPIGQDVCEEERQIPSVREVVQ